MHNLLPRETSIFGFSRCARRGGRRAHHLRQSGVWVGAEQRLQEMPHRPAPQHHRRSAAQQLAARGQSLPCPAGHEASVHLKTSGFLRVLRTRDRIVRSNTRFIHSLLEQARSGQQQPQENQRDSEQFVHAA